MQFRQRSNIPPPAPEKRFSCRVLCETEKSHRTVNSIKLSLDGVTNQFLKTEVFGKG